MNKKTTAAPGGLLFDAADLPRLRANLESPLFAEVRREVFPEDLAAVERFLREEINLTDRIVDMARARKIAEHAALAFALTREPRQLEIARLALRRLSEYEAWDFFLEGGIHRIGLQRAPEATIACCLALDWLGDDLPPEEREEIEEQIITKGAPACFNTLYGMKYPDRVRGWTLDPKENFPFQTDMSRFPLILNSTNLKVIPLCGLGMAALWFHGRHPEAPRWMDLARSSARAFATMYGLDGSYDEGVSYWGYTTTHLVLFAEALYRRLGIDDRGLVNYPGTLRYALSMVMRSEGPPAVNPNEKKEYNAVPKGVVNLGNGVVNFGDAMGVDFTVAGWVARVHGDPLGNHIVRHLGAQNLWPAAVWFDPDGPEEAPGPELLDVRLANDIVVSRTGWSAADGVAALRSGGPGNHEHADRNSVVFAAHGERLFHDPVKAAYIPTNPRWRLRLTESHTAVLIDGKGHQYHDGREGTHASWAWAHVTDYRTGSGWMSVSSDATDAYQLVIPDVKRVLRSLLFLKPDVIVLLDQVKLKTAAPVQMRFQVYNEDGKGRASAGSDAFAIQRPFAHLTATVRSRGQVQIHTDRLDLPDADGIHPFVEVVSRSATRHAVLTVISARPKEEEPGRLEIEAEGKGWRVQGSHRGRVVEARVMPEASPPLTVRE